MHVVTVATVDCYLTHASENTPGIDIQQGKTEVGNFLTSLRDLNNLELDITLNGRTELKEMTRLGLVRELDLKLAELPDPDQNIFRMLLYTIFQFNNFRPNQNFLVIFIIRIFFDFLFVNY